MGVLHEQEEFGDFYSVPDFQREYIWEDEHVERLLEDVVAALYDENRAPIADAQYFVGSVVVCPDPDDPQVLQLIDGQQRLTTFFLLLCAIRDVIRAADAPVPQNLAARIAQSTPDPNTGLDVDRFRLVLQYADSVGLLGEIAGGEAWSTVELTTQSMRRLASAYGYIRGFLSQRYDDDPQQVLAFFAQMIYRVYVVSIQTQNLASALLVFETINHRGVELKPEDLLKNLLFRNAPADQFQALKDGWRTLMDIVVEKCGERRPSRFLRHYLLSRYVADPRQIREDQLYNWFAANAAEYGIQDRPREFVGELIEAARAYNNFSRGQDANGDRNYYLENIGRFARSARQHFIVLMAARNLSQELFSRLCKRLEDLIFCYTVTKQPGSRYEQTFARSAARVGEITDEAALDAFLAENFDREIAALSADVDFAFQTMREDSLYPYRLKYVLGKLDQFIDRAAWQNQADESLERYVARAVDVEHILPDTPPPGLREAFDQPESYDEYARRLGNLALLEDTINRAIQNRPYNEKQAGYRQSQFALVRSLVEVPRVGGNTRLNRAMEGLRAFEDWTSASIEQRQAMLTSLAFRVWNVPEPPRAGEEGDGT